MSAAEPDRGATGARLGERVCLAVLLVVAFVLRTRHIEDFYIGPDDGSYLHSAQVELLQHDGFHPLRWIGEDVSWIRHVAVKYTVDDHDTYQHSYLHQWVARWLYRLGCGALQSLRWSSALTGTLTVFFAWWLFVRLWPTRRRLGLLAAAVVACVPFHVFYSRTGWGQVGFACFYLAYCVVLYRLLFEIEEHDRRTLRWSGWSLLALSLLAFGWQEGVSPYILGCIAVVLAAPWIQRRAGDERGWKESVLRSRRTWTFVWSAIPIGSATVLTALFNPLAKRTWFNERGLADLDWLELKRQSLQDIVAHQRVDLQIGWLVIVLAIIGLVAWLRANKGLARFLVATSGIGGLILLFGFGDAMLLRAYMPVWIVVFLCAAVGIASCATWIGARGGHLLAVVFVVGVIGCLLATTWISLFGSVENPFFVQRLYAREAEGDLDKRNVDLQILERLRSEIRAGETVGAFGEKSPIVRLQDIGIPAQEVDLAEANKSSWPTWIMGRRNMLDQGKRVTQNGGEYELVVGDTIGRFGLYHRVK